jgi:hypothetical protein
VEPTAAGQATVVRVGDFIASVIGRNRAFTIVKWNWAKPRPRLRLEAGLGLNSRATPVSPVGRGATVGVTQEVSGWQAHTRVRRRAVPSRKGRSCMPPRTTTGSTSRPGNHGHQTVFVEATYMVSRFHEMVAPSTRSWPAARQPRLPWYTATDRCIVVRRLLEERMVLRNMYKVPVTPRRAGASSPVHAGRRGRFRDNQKNSLSVPIIPLAEVLAHPRWRGGSAGPGLPEPPIVLSNHPQHGVHGGSKARQAGDVTVSVKSTLTRLKGRETTRRPWRPPTMSRAPRGSGATS